MSSLPPTVVLNNYLQNQGRLPALSYAEVDNGPSAANRWSIAVKVNGQLLGAASAPLKAVAKEEAARQACARLGAA